MGWSMDPGPTFPRRNFRTESQLYHLVARRECDAGLLGEMPNLATGVFKGVSRDRWQEPTAWK
jgi:hypothetical protein